MTRGNQRDLAREKAQKKQQVMARYLSDFVQLLMKGHLTRLVNQTLHLKVNGSFDALETSINDRSQHSFCFWLNVLTSLNSDEM